MKKIKILSFTIGMFLSANVFSQHVLVNEVDINNEDIQFCELRVTARLLNPTKVKMRELDLALLHLKMQKLN